MKFLTGLLVFVSLASLPLNAKVITLTSFYEKLSLMFSESCPDESPSSGLELFKSELAQCYSDKALPEPEELKLKGVPLGLEGDFPDVYLYASSFRDDFSFPALGRLNLVKEGDLNGAWCSEVNNDLQFFQVDMGAVSTVTAIFTQGDNDELNWVKSYTLEISMDGYHWGCVFGSDGRVKVFDANKDSDSVKINVMHPFIETRYIRIVPKSWTGHICMRVEIYVDEIVPRDEPEDPEPIPDFETKVLEVNPKGPDALVVKNDEPNQVDTGMLPAEYTDVRHSPIKSISFEHLKLQPDLYKVWPAGVVGKPLEPNTKVEPLVVSGGGPVVDRTIAPGFYSIPVEVSTFGEIPPAYTFEFDWGPGRYDVNMYLEFSFSYPVNIRGFSTKGRPLSMEYVLAYKVEYLHPYLNKWVYLKGEDKEDIRIEGNTDDSTSRDHIYEPAIFTSRFRMYILEWELKPYMTVQLYMGAEPREAPQIVTGPIYQEGLIWWAWEELKAEEGYTQEVYFVEELTLLAFEFGVQSTIEEYELQYQTVDGEWASIFGDETSILSNGDGIDVNGKVAKGLRIIIVSWSGDRLFAEINLEIDVGTENVIEIADIVELSSHYLFFKWEDSEPISGSAVYFDFDGEIRQVTRMETRGIGGAWASSYQLECRTHFAENGIVMDLAGNSNDEDIVEHIFSDPTLHCKYLFIKPDVTDGIGMEVYIYTDAELEDATARILVPGTKGGNTAGRWSPAEFGDNPYIQFKFSHHITPTKITLNAGEGSSVTSFELQKSSDGENFEPVLDGEGNVKVFELGDTNFERQFEARSLRIFPDVPENPEGGIGFEWDIHFKSEKTVTVVPELQPGVGEEETDTGGPRVVLNGNYNSPGQDDGQYVRLSFEKPETVNEFRLTGEYLGSIVTVFRLQYKTETSEDYIIFTYEGQEEIEADEDGASIDMGGLLLTELKCDILTATGEGTKFEYQIEFTGNVGRYRTSNAFLDSQAELANL